ncbi:CTLH/CRA C-terminal to lish motif domain-containing protein [Bisporella sp. PMI_857]|nr:CTLH/CRA C-terminal to lish motif domain-containing protein [Bisporella sp. PMI_857]
MDTLQLELARMRRDANLKQSVDDVDKIIEQLERARETIVADPQSAPITLSKLQNPLKSGFDKVNDDMAKTYKAHNVYGKALDKNFPVKKLPTEYDALASHPSLINRAIAMHLLREGQFSVASTFLDEARENPPQPAPTPGSPHPSQSDAGDFTSLKSSELQHKFANMYAILHELKAHNLHPAISWARSNSVELERRGSNLEFELSKLQFVWLFQGPSINGLPDTYENGLEGALLYARENFGRFQGRFLRDIQQLATAMAFRSNLRDSPYHHTFNTETAWGDVALSFTREFCSLLGLSAESPLYIAATAGAIALPTLLKLASIVKEKRTEWTTQDELPVEIALPGSMIFHAIFVCPVSKEQTTESNPPMMMPCGHVVAKESLQRLSKGGRFKCPYCPNESQPKDAMEIIL